MNGRKNKLQGKRKRRKPPPPERREEELTLTHRTCGCPPVVDKPRVRPGAKPSYWVHCSECSSDDGAEANTLREALKMWNEQQE